MENKQYDLEEIKNIEFDKVMMSPKELCSQLGVPLKTCRTWIHRNELGWPIVIRIKDSRRIMLQPKPFVSWLVDNKITRGMTPTENLTYYNKQIKAMHKARGIR